MAFLVAAGTSGDNPTTSGIDTTGATFISAVVSYWMGGDDPPTMSDSKGNTWNRLTAYTTGVNAKVVIFWCVPSSVGSSHTFSTTADACSINVAAFDDDFAASPFDLENGTGTNPAASLQPGSITPSQDNCLVVTGIAFGTGGNDVESIDSGFTIASQAGDGSGNFRGAIAYKYQATAAAVNPTWSVGTGAPQMAVSIASFKTDAGGVAGSPWYYYQNQVLCGGF